MSDIEQVRAGVAAGKETIEKEVNPNLAGSAKKIGEIIALANEAKSELEGLNSGTDKARGQYNQAMEEHPLNKEAQGTLNESDKIAGETLTALGSVLELLTPRPEIHDERAQVNMAVADKIVTWSNTKL